ncbi:hypothetical protein MYSTI_04040 [Myxococcus stipitatus DSM 14675]|uniref:Secreted protein n=1 Tax=Myxococcus stipitatus (strain DSM 14675 / JCM 12634 / Mx s8) TaxID=1278073 RepID=L7U8T2_MYXSD|nr:hypothetical protein [Myxococcus stipitatus]AGC45341.1 hypothetical protein MYSTI_04040 [Myxococcus stipitatus DSM 14675]
MSRHRPVSLLMMCLASSLAFADAQEPIPEHDLEPVPPDEEIVPALLQDAFSDAEPGLEEALGDDFASEGQFLVGDVLYTAQEIREQGIHISHFVVDDNAAERQAILGFRTTDELQIYLFMTGKYPSETPQGVQLQCPQVDSPAYFFMDTAYDTGEGYFALWPGMALSRLGRWNDKISSLWGAPCATWTVIHQHSDFKGRKLWVYRGTAIRSLRWHGFAEWWGPFAYWASWNDRVSSVQILW